MRKKKNKSKTQIESENAHAAYLARIGYVPKHKRNKFTSKEKFFKTR